MGRLAADVFGRRTRGLGRLTELDSWVLGQALRGAGDGVGRSELLELPVLRRGVLRREHRARTEDGRRCARAWLAALTSRQSRSTKWMRNARRAPTTVGGSSTRRIDPSLRLTRGARAASPKLSVQPLLCSSSRASVANSPCRSETTSWRHRRRETTSLWSPGHQGRGPPSGRCRRAVVVGRSRGTRPRGRRFSLGGCMPMRWAPPTLGSNSISLSNPAGPHHLAKAAGSVSARKTGSREACRTSSRSRTRPSG